MTKKLQRRVTASARLGWGIAREAGASVLTYELYPLGLVGRSMPTLPTLRKFSEVREQRPILFIHGIFHNRTAFAWIKQRLAYRGFRHFKELDLFTSLHSMANLAEETAAQVSRLMKQYGSREIDIIAHSMGGLIARYYVQFLGGDGLVKNLITLGTPHGGTEWSRYSVLPHIRELNPKSRLIARLNTSPPPRLTRAVTIAGDLDLLMRPRHCTHWEGARNIRLKGLGHAGLLFSKRVFQIIVSHLEEGEE